MLYGPCCIEQARSAGAWSCGSCGGLYSEEDMVAADLCRFCVPGRISEHGQDP